MCESPARPGTGSLHVVPRFKGRRGLTSDLPSAFDHRDGAVNLDVAAIASMLSLQYLLDGHSLLSEVPRQPWLESVGPDCQSALATYGRRATTTTQAARGLLSRLRIELLEAFADAERITLLLSGGLDSRLASAAVVGLAREGKVTDQIRAVTWGMHGCRDRHYGQLVARHLGVKWLPIDLGPAQLERNIFLAAHQLAGLVSPVHLHAMDSVRRLDWQRGDRILAATLGNGVGRGQYLYRHISSARTIELRDWLGLMRPDVYAPARTQLLDELAAFRSRLRQYGRMAAHECEMLAHYVSGLLLPALDFLRRTAAPVHQALSDPRTYRYLWSLAPFVRTESMYRTALRLCDPELVEIPYTLTNRAPKRPGAASCEDLSAFLHRYPMWIAHDLADLVEERLAQAWFDETGIFDGSAVRRAWNSVRRSPSPHAPTAYLLVWLCTLRCLVDDLGIETGGADGMTRRHARAEVRDPVVQRPPWGFAGRGPDGGWARVALLPVAAGNTLQCRPRWDRSVRSPTEASSGTRT